MNSVVNKQIKLLIEGEEQHLGGMQTYPWQITGTTIANSRNIIQQMQFPKIYKNFHFEKLFLDSILISSIGLLIAPVIFATLKGMKRQLFLELRQC